MDSAAHPCVKASCDGQEQRAFLPRLATVSGMSNRSHLTPTVITDKNGKTTTVRKRQPSVQGVPATIPAPAVGPAAPQIKRQRRKLSEEEIELKLAMERKRLINKTIKNLYKDQRVRKIEPYKSSGISGRLSYFENNAYIRDIAAVAELVTRDDLSPQEFDEDRNALVYDIWEKHLHIDHFAKMRSVAHYRDWMRENNVRYKDFMRLRDILGATGEHRNSPDGAVKNLEAHYAVITAMGKDASSKPYGKNNPITLAVDNHPEQVDHLITFVQDRGTAAYTDEAFREYMSTASSSLREGWL